MLMMWVMENANGIAIRYYIWIAAEQKWLFSLRVKDIEHTVGPVETPAPTISDKTVMEGLTLSLVMPFCLWLK